MDRVKKYRKIVRTILAEHQGFPTRDFPNLQDILVVDAQEQHFLSLTIGWDRGAFVHDTVYHLEVKDDGQVWIYQVHSDVEIDRELVEKGVREEDIRVGLLEPYELEKSEDFVGVED